MKKESQEIILNLIKSLDTTKVTHTCGKRETTTPHTHDCQLDQFGWKNK